MWKALSWHNLDFPRSDHPNKAQPLPGSSLIALNRNRSPPLWCESRYTMKSQPWHGLFLVSNGRIEDYANFHSYLGKGILTGLFTIFCISQSEGGIFKDPLSWAAPGDGLALLRSLPHRCGKGLSLQTLSRKTQPPEGTGEARPWSNRKTARMVVGPGPGWALKSLVPTQKKAPKCCWGRGWIIFRAHEKQSLFYPVKSQVNPTISPVL